jgi:hypothetical protein
MGNPPFAVQITCCFYENIVVFSHPEKDHFGNPKQHVRVFAAFDLQKRVMRPFYK